MSSRQALLELALDRDELDHLFEEVDDEKCSLFDLLWVSGMSTGVIGFCAIVHALFT